MPRCLRFALFALLLLLPSCLEFDAQEITFRYDPQQDRIDALVVYRGLFVEGGTGSSDKPVEKALQDLARVQKEGNFFFWCNWPFAVHPTTDTGPGAVLLSHLEIETGGLFTDPKGVLCGYQFVRIRDAKAFVQKLNTLLEVAAQAAMLGGFQGFGQNHKFSADTKDLLREFLRSGEKLLLIEQGRVELRLPCTLADHRFLKGQLEQYFLSNMPGEMLRRVGVEEHRAQGGDVTQTAVVTKALEIPAEQLKESLRTSASFRFFWDNDLSIDRRDDLTTVAVGERGGEELRVMKAPEGLYHDGLLTHLRERGDKIEDGLPDQELQRRFEAFRGRECVLPEALAAHRKGAAK